MMVIWKYELPADQAAENDGVIKIRMPKGSEVLHAGAQGDKVCVWARVDSSQLDVERTFVVRLTGEEAPPMDYLGTALLRDGQFVVHVFVVPAGTRSVPR